MLSEPILVVQQVIVINIKGRGGGGQGKYSNKYVWDCGYASPLQKINYTDKCLWYFHPSYGSDNREIAAESWKIYRYPYYLSVLSGKHPATLIEIAVHLSSKGLHTLHRENEFPLT